MIEWELQLNPREKERKMESFCSWMNDQSSRILIGTVREGWNEFLYTDRLSFTHCWTIKQSKFTEYTHTKLIGHGYAIGNQPLLLIHLSPFCNICAVFQKRDQKREKEFILKMCFKTNGNSAINMWYTYHARYLCILNLEFFFYCAANFIKVASQCNLVVPCTILLCICIIVILLHHCLCDCDCDCNL